MAGAAIGRLAERPDVIVLDVGGTSADVSLSRRGRPLIRPEWNIEFNIVISFPSVDVTAIGAGGGSIARIDEGGVLKVGPKSAGARPGPACYGQGGIQPTATDANLVLGRLGAETKLAGRVVLHPEDCRAGHRPDRGASGLFAGGSRHRNLACHARQHGGRDPPRLGEARP